MALSEYSVLATGNFSTNKQVVAGTTPNAGGVLHGVMLISNGTNACNITVYHGTAATAGNELGTLSIAASTAAPQFLIFNNPISCPDGIFAAPAGTGVIANVYYSLGS